MPTRKIQPYNPELKKYARELRKNMTDAERLLWSRIRKKQVRDAPFLRQRPIGKYIVDFYSPEMNLVVEVNGGQHFEKLGKAADEERDAFLQSRGLKILRFSNVDVLKNLDAVVEVIFQHVSELKKIASP